jgi:hypothetical protein
MKKLIVAVAIFVVVLVALAVGGLYYMKSKLTSFPEFEIKAEKTSVHDDEIFSWIEQIVAFGPRKPATDGDDKTREFITAKFHEFGLTVEEPEPFDVETQRVSGWSFSLTDKKTGEEIEVPTYYIPFPAPTPAEGVEAELVYIGESEELDDIDMEGKIVVFDQLAKTQKYDTFKRTFFYHDPAGTFTDDYAQVHQEAKYGRIIHDKVVAKGAVGMVGLLSHLQWESDGFCPQMNRGVSKQIPGYWVSPKNSALVKEWLERDDVVGKMMMDSELGRSQSYNVWARLPGGSDEYYIVMGHHDAPFANAVQDASGTSVMLAVAKHFGQIERGRPLKRGIIFLAIGAHTLGRLGERAYVEQHRDDILPKSALVVSVEHIAKDLVPQDDLSFKVSDLPSPRLIMTADNENVNGIVKSSILHNDYRRSLLLPQWIVKQTTGRSRGISGEFYDAGAPTVGILPNPQYIFFKEDTPDAVARDQLVPTANLIISMLRAADELPLDELR